MRTEPTALCHSSPSSLCWTFLVIRGEHLSWKGARHQHASMRGKDAPDEVVILVYPSAVSLSPSSRPRAPKKLGPVTPGTPSVTYIRAVPATRSERPHLQPRGLCSNLWKRPSSPRVTGASFLTIVVSTLADWSAATSGTGRGITHHRGGGWRTGRRQSGTGRE
jgi:hypothetical protein